MNSVSALKSTVTEYTMAIKEVESHDIIQVWPGWDTGFREFTKLMRILSNLSGEKYLAAHAKRHMFFLPFPGKIKQKKHTLVLLKTLFWASIKF